MIAGSEVRMTASKLGKLAARGAALTLDSAVTISDKSAKEVDAKEAAIFAAEEDAAEAEEDATPLAR